MTVFLICKNGNEKSADCRLFTYEMINHFEIYNIDEYSVVALVIGYLSISYLQ